MDQPLLWNPKKSKAKNVNILLVTGILSCLLFYSLRHVLFHNSAPKRNVNIIVDHSGLKTYNFVEGFARPRLEIPLSQPKAKVGKSGDDTTDLKDKFFSMIINPGYENRKESAEKRDKEYFKEIKDRAKRMDKEVVAVMKDRKKRMDDESIALKEKLGMDAEEAKNELQDTEAPKEENPNPTTTATITTTTITSSTTTPKTTTTSCCEAITLECISCQASLDAGEFCEQNPLNVLCTQEEPENPPATTSTSSTSTTASTTLATEPSSTTIGSTTSTKLPEKWTPKSDSDEDKPAAQR